MASLREWIIEKLNPVQDRIAYDEGTDVQSNAPVTTYINALKNFGSVNRGINMVVSACASLDYDVKNKVIEGTILGARAKSLHSLLNFKPNPFQSIQEFRQQIFTDFILEGNIFIYYDGVYLYHLPAAKMVVHPDTKTFVNHYSYDNKPDTKYSPEEIIHIKDISGDTIYRGTSRLVSVTKELELLTKMKSFQAAFFDNGAIPGMVVTTENTMSEAAKDRTVNRWMQKFSVRSGTSRRPLILDSGLKPVKIADTNFREMDFDTSIKTNNVKILESLGVPPVLLDGGNQANISPNLRLFYLETVLPIVRKYTSALERMFGYDVEAVVNSVSALQPEMKDISAYYSTLVNGGIVKPNEAREALRLEKDTDPESDKLRIPANIAGSAANPSQGGAPKKPTAN